MMLRLLIHIANYWRHLLLSVLLIAMLSGVMLPLGILPFGALVLVMAVVVTFLQVLIAVSWYLARYRNAVALPVGQQLLNAIALFVVAQVGCLLVIYGLLNWWFSAELSAQSVRLFPLLVSLSGLSYMIVLMRMQTIMTSESNDGETESIVSDASSDTKATVEDLQLLERVAVKSGAKIHVVLTAEIICLQADGDYVHIFTMHGKYMKEQTMKYFEENLPGQFVRVHRSYIVNIESVSRIELYEKQSQLLTLKNGMQLKVSQAGYRLLREKLKL